MWNNGSERAEAEVGAGGREAEECTAVKHKMREASFHYFKTSNRYYSLLNAKNTDNTVLRAIGLRDIVSNA